MAEHLGEQVHPLKVPCVRSTTVGRQSKPLVIICTQDEGDLEIAKYREGILKMKEYETELFPHDHMQPSDAIAREAKDRLIALLYDCNKALIIVSMYMIQSAFLEVILDIVQTLSEQRNSPILIVYKLDSADMSSMPRRLRSGSCIVPIREDKYNRKRFVAHSDRDNDIGMEILVAIKDCAEITCKMNNVAHGLVSGYFLGYLEFKLPLLKDAISKTYESQKPTWNKTIRPEQLYKKLIILLPESCQTHDRLDHVDSNIQYLMNNSSNGGGLEDVKIECQFDKGGVKKRDYSSSLCSVSGTVLQQEKTYICPIEYATPLNHLFELCRRGSIYEYTEEDKDADFDEFKHNLCQILESSKPCHDTYLFIEYNDAVTSKPLAQRIVQEIENDLARQQTINMVTEHVHDH